MGAYKAVGSLSMNPLKQGLKHWLSYECVFYGKSLSMNPLKQGLKRQAYDTAIKLLEVFIHESIKTRVET